MLKTTTISLTNQEKEFWNQINQIRETGNFQTLRSRIGIKKLKSELIKLYPENNITEIEKITDIPDSTLEYWFNRLEIPFKRNHISGLSIPASKNDEWIEDRNNAVYKISMVEITPELAYAIGFALGDGTVENFSVDFFNKDTAILEKLLVYLSPYGTVGKRTREDGLWRLRLSSKKIANLIKDKKIIRKDTVEYILRNEILAQKFIAAFWDAEGSVLKQKNYYHVYLYNSDKWILDQIKIKLESKNINTSLITLKEKRKSFYYKNRKITPRKTIYRLGIPKKSLKNWADFIGVNLLHGKKSKLVKNILKGGNTHE